MLLNNRYHVNAKICVFPVMMVHFGDKKLLIIEEGKMKMSCVIFIGRFHISSWYVFGFQICFNSIACDVKHLFFLSSINIQG